MKTLFLSQPSTVAPGSGAAPAPAQATQGVPSAPADGGAAPQSPFGSMTMLLAFIPLVLLLFMSRNQNKKQKEIEEALKPGDQVVTTGGLCGRIVDIGDNFIKLEIAPGVNVKVRKSAIAGPEAEPKAADAKDKEKTSGKAAEAKEKKA